MGDVFSALCVEPCIQIQESGIGRKRNNPKKDGKDIEVNEGTPDEKQKFVIQPITLSNPDRKSTAFQMKNICSMNKKSFNLKHISNNHYVVTFNYSTNLNVYCTIYFFANELLNDHNCTVEYRECVERAIYNQNKQYVGTSYLLKKGYNLYFQQTNKDFLNLDDTDVKFFENNPPLNYYAIIVAFSLKKPEKALLVNDNTKTDNMNVNLNEYINRTVNYCKLKLNYNNGIYDSQIISQRTEAQNRSFQSQDIYGLDMDVKDGHLCVICLDEAKDTVFLPCSHLCVCNNCAAEIMKESKKCPICRATATDTMHVKTNTTQK